MTCLTSRPRQAVPGSVCLVVSGAASAAAVHVVLVPSTVESAIVGIGGYPPGVSSFQRLDAIPPIIVATCVSFLDHDPSLANETEPETCVRIYISSRHLSACVPARGHSTHPFFLHASSKDTMKLNSEKVELPRPRPALSLVSTSPRVSELEDAASTREGDADEFSLVQLHHRLELECLPPVDQGKHAYLFLLACFILEALIWGEDTPIPVFSSPRPLFPLFSEKIRQDVSGRIPSHSNSFRKRA